MKVKKGDNVIILSGKDKGKNGKILQSIPKLDRVVVEGVNVRKRHMRPRKQGEKGQIIERESPIHFSNVMLMCGKCNKPTRVGFKILEDGAKVRVCKNKECGEIISN